MPKSLTIVDLFSGCGGLALGFERSGFKVLSAVDSWQPAVATCAANFCHTAVEAQIHAETELPPADVIVGGPPCQGFSSAGLRKDDDERNTLISVFAKLVARHKPTAFVFENVEGFLTGAGGKFIFELLEPLVEAGYRIHLRKINASNYGVPQHRKRVVAIGGLGWDPSFPSHTHSSLGAPGSTLLNGHHLPFTPTLEQALAGLPPAQNRSGRYDSSPSEHFFTPFNAADQERAKLLQEGQRMRDLPEEYWHESYKKRANRRVKDGTPTERRGGAPSGLRRLAGSEPSKAITGGALREFVHPTEDRPLTVRECARLQTFPDDFEFLGTQGDKIQMIGNAVPPRLAERIAASLFEDLSRKRCLESKGALLTFVPTFSSGMSPILQKVTSAIHSRFRPSETVRQGELCL